LSHSFTEKGQRKKIIDDHDKLCSEIEISKLLSNNKIFQHRYQFSNTPLMFVQTFRSYFSEEIFCMVLSEWLNAQVCISFKKQKKQADQFKSKPKQKANERCKQKKYLHNIQGQFIKQSIFSGLGHSPDRCQAALQDSVIERN
jgi:hypothetical protein